MPDARKALTKFSQHETMRAPHGEIIMSEEAHAMALMQWAKIASNTTPELKWLFHIPNGGFRSKRTAIRMKAMGVLRGVSDYLLPISRGKYHGLFVELKTDKGKLSDEQFAFLDKMNKEGYLGLVAKGWEEASKMIMNYLSQAKG